MSTTENNDDCHDDPVSQFYLSRLPGKWQDRTVFTAECPFCREKGVAPAGRMIVYLNRDGFFHGYFRCLSRCVPGGFPLWYARLAGIELSGVPGYDPERDLMLQQIDYPLANSNTEMRKYCDNLTDNLIQSFAGTGISAHVLQEMQIGYNGRYLTYPYIQADGNCYALRCVFPDRPEDYFWHGDERFSKDPFQVFNVQDIERCENGALFICEGEENLLALKQIGFPGVAVPHCNSFETIRTEQFAAVHTVFILVGNTPESAMAARSLAARLGHKARLLRWPAGFARNYSLRQLARDQGSEFRRAVSRMIQGSRSFSPFATPQHEYNRFQIRLSRQEESAVGLSSGFVCFDQTLAGVNGINVVGGAPKIGKSSFMIQVASQMALRGVPVIYYDFENGRQKIYQRILSRISRREVGALGTVVDVDGDDGRFTEAHSDFRRMLEVFRVVNDRQLTPDMMRRHIDFLRHETRSENAVVVIDSLHKLPFKDLPERRTGIDAWLRQMESIRDELQVSFLVISELTRGSDGSYNERPHLGVFKGSGDIEYSADNALVLFPATDGLNTGGESIRRYELWLVASREHSPGLVATYNLDYPYWGFIEEEP
jgi:replicative DNA helicase